MCSYKISYYDLSTVYYILNNMDEEQLPRLERTIVVLQINCYTLYFQAKHIYG